MEGVGVVDSATSLQDVSQQPINQRDPPGFSAEQVQKIAQVAVEKVVGVDNVAYDAAKVN